MLSTRFAMLLLVYQGRDWHQYILSARGIMSGTLSNFGLSLGAVYIIWILVASYCYIQFAEGIKTIVGIIQSKWWLSYL